MLRCALFKNFNGADSFLIWGHNADARKLHAGLLAMLVLQSECFRIEGGLGIAALLLQRSEGECASELRGTPSEAIWRFSMDILANVTASVESLTTHTGHHYFDVNSDFASQVMISANEYPETLRP